MISKQNTDSLMYVIKTGKFSTDKEMKSFKC